MINIRNFADMMQEKNPNYEEEIEVYNEVKSLLDEVNGWTTTGQLEIDIEEYNTRFKNVATPRKFKRLPAEVVGERYETYKRFVQRFEELNFRQNQEER